MSIINNTDRNIWDLMKHYNGDLMGLDSSKIGVIIFSEYGLVVYDQDSKLVLDTNKGA